MKHLPPGSVQFETVIESDVLGSVIQDTNGNEPGLIGYLKDGQQKSIIFFIKDCDPKSIPNLGDKVIETSLSRVLENYKFVLLLIVKVNFSFFDVLGSI